MRTDIKQPSRGVHSCCKHHCPSHQMYHNHVALTIVPELFIEPPAPDNTAWMIGCHQRSQQSYCEQYFTNSQLQLYTQHLQNRDAAYRYCSMISGWDPRHARPPNELRGHVTRTELSRLPTMISDNGTLQLQDHYCKPIKNAQVIIAWFSMIAYGLWAYWIKCCIW